MQVFTGQDGRMVKTAMVMNYSLTYQKYIKIILVFCY